MPPLPSPSLQKQQQNSPISPSTARCRAAAVQRQQGSTDSAPTSAGISSMKRKEIWARVGPSSFHQSFDIRSDPITNFSTSCGHINDAVGGGVCCACKGYRTERRSGFCSGDSSRDSRSHPGNAALTLYCGVAGMFFWTILYFKIFLIFDRKIILHYSCVSMILNYLFCYLLDSTRYLKTSKFIYFSKSFHYICFSCFFLVIYFWVNWIFGYFNF
uniref:Uncharacterized protein n=1 Tax=Meloidogyne enterolobii TaxID=390850 RepID=A0A6V7XUL5_MELEN|nr:unnamed protein product [Meloidogyne enterolobii]